MSAANKQTKVRGVEIVAKYQPDSDRMLQALMLLLDIDEDSLPGDHEDALYLSDAVS